jgi:hypothetical protein
VSFSKEHLVETKKSLQHSLECSANLRDVVRVALIVVFRRMGRLRGARIT